MVGRRGSVRAAADETASEPAPGWRRRGHAIAFGVLSAVGMPMLALGWLFQYLAFVEEAEDWYKALAANTTMAGTTLWMGTLPLVVLHAIGFFALWGVACRGREPKRTAWCLAAAHVAGASLLGIVVTLALTGGLLIAPHP